MPPESVRSVPGCVKLWFYLMLAALPVMLLSLFSVNWFVLPFQDALALGLASVSFVLIFARLYIGDRIIFLIESRNFKLNSHGSSAVGSALVIMQGGCVVGLGCTLGQQPIKFLICAIALLMLNICWLVGKARLYLRFAQKIVGRQSRTASYTVFAAGNMLFWIGNNAVCVLIVLALVYEVGPSAWTLNLAILVTIASSCADFIGTWKFYQVGKRILDSSTAQAFG